MRGQLTSHQMDKNPNAFWYNVLQKLLPGSAISNGREPRSCLGRVFSFKLDTFTSKHHKCAACKWALLKLKTLARFCPVGWSLSILLLFLTKHALKQVETLGCYCCVFPLPDPHTSLRWSAHTDGTLKHNEVIFTTIRNLYMGPVR